MVTHAAAPRVAQARLSTRSPAAAAATARPTASTAARPRSSAPRWRSRPVQQRRRVAVARAASRESVGDDEAPPEAEDSGVVVGIDLGTTNSAIAVIEGGRPVVIPTAEGKLTTPSVVAFLPEGGVLVGEAARRQAALNPGNTFHSVKRLIGRSWEDVEAEAEGLAYQVAADEDGDTVLRCEHSETGQLFPEEVSAHVLAKLLVDAEAYTGRPISKAVISVPAYFNDEQREATAAAGRIAGLETVRIIREPVAAALAYGLDAQEDQTVLVFDLGGGTFDVSLLEVGGGVIEVLSTGGDPHLGGDDWDAALVRWLGEKHLRPKGVNWQEPRTLANLRALAEATKVALSGREQVVVRLPLAGGIEATLTRQALERLTADLFRRARLPLDRACWQAGVDLGTVVAEHEEAQRRSGGKKQRGRRRGGDPAAEGVQIRPKRRMPVSKVLLVGGATRMPAVRTFVRNMTGIDPTEFVVDPDLAVALGAAVQAGIYEGQVPDLMVMDVWQASLMRAFARQLEIEREQAEGSAEQGEEEEEGEGADASPGSDEEWEEEGAWEEEEEEEEQQTAAAATAE